jgi:hypothetical protein
MSRTRRDFLRSCAVLGATGAASQLERLGAVTAHAQTSPGYKALVCICMFGGNDSNNMIVPIDSRYAAYAAMRGPVALASGALLPAGTSGFGLHPALTNIQRLYNQNAAALALNVGTLVQPTTKATLQSVALPRSLQSHSDQTQQWQSSDPNGGETGWGGRVNDLMGALNTGALTPGITVNSGNALFLSGTRTGAVNVSSAASSGLLSFGSSSAMVKAGRVAAAAVDLRHGAAAGDGGERRAERLAPIHPGDERRAGERAGPAGDVSRQRPPAAARAVPSMPPTPFSVTASARHLAAPAPCAPPFRKATPSPLGRTDFAAGRYLHDHHSWASRQQLGDWRPQRQHGHDPAQRRPLRHRLLRSPRAQRLHR